MSALDSHATTVLVKCGRCCCLCRRFRPIRLQVHHIVPRSEGGSDELDNLIALCLTCHTDVHTNAPFTRRFTARELREHRDGVYQLVLDGKLPSAGMNSDATPTLRLDNLSLPQIRSEASVSNGLNHKAIEMLIAAAQSEAGAIMVMRAYGDDLSITAGSVEMLGSSDPRERALCKHAIDQLSSARLIERSAGGDTSFQEYLVTHAGYLRADEILATGTTT